MLPFTNVKLVFMDWPEAVLTLAQKPATRGATPLRSTTLNG